MKRLFNFRLMPLLLAGIVLGICAITFCPKSLAILFVILSVIVVLCAIFVKQMRRARFKTIAVALIFLIAMGVASLSYLRMQNREIYTENSIVEGRVCLMSDSDGSGAVIVGEDKTVYLDGLKASGVKLDGIAQATFVDESLLQNLHIGDTIRFKADVSSINMSVTDSYGVSKYIDRVYYRVYCLENSGDKDGIFTYIGNDIKLTERIKLKVKDALYGNVSDTTAGFLYAMTFGDTSGLDQGVKTDFKMTGTAHIFAVSGLHVGIIAGALLWILKALRVKSPPAKLVAMAIVLIPYCALCGFSASTVRATVMTLVAMTARTLAFRSDSLSNLASAGALILLIDPINLFNIGFLMSFFAVFGLIMLSSPIQRILARIMPKKIASAFAATLSVNVSLLPIMTLYFGGQSLLCLIANLAVLPIAGIMFPIYLIAVVACSAMPFAGILLTIASAPFTLMIKIVSRISDMGGVSVYFESGAFLIFFNILAVVFLSEYFFVVGQAKKIAAGVMTLCFCVTACLNARSVGSEYVTVYCFTDKYDCQYVLLDNASGGSYLVLNGRMSGDTVNAVTSFMKNRGFCDIDGIIISGEGMSKNSLRILAEKTGCTLICAYDPSRYTDVFAQCADILSESNFDVYFSSSGCVEVLAKDTRIKILGDGYLPADSHCDILVAYDPYFQDSSANYTVCERGYENSLQNYLPSTFTFRLKNGRILMNPSWRY